MVDVLASDNQLCAIVRIYLFVPTGAKLTTTCMQRLLVTCVAAHWHATRPVCRMYAAQWARCIPSPSSHPPSPRLPLPLLDPPSVAAPSQGMLCCAGTALAVNVPGLYYLMKI